MRIFRLNAGCGHGTERIFKSLVHINVTIQQNFNGKFIPNLINIEQLLIAL
jgi:hypothetical protein